MKKEILAYAITHAPRGVKGGPYEGQGPPGDEVASMALAMRYAPADADVCREDAAYVVRNGHDARVIRIVRARPSEIARREVVRAAMAWAEGGRTRDEAAELLVALSGAVDAYREAGGK